MGRYGRKAIEDNIYSGIDLASKTNHVNSRVKCEMSYNVESQPSKLTYPAPLLLEVEQQKQQMVLLNNER